MDEERPLNIVEAARRLGVHQNTLRRWADEGKVPHFRTLGAKHGLRRFQPSVIDRIRKEMGFTDPAAASVDADE